MRTLLWAMWDLLTHKTYRVKIVKYDDVTTHYTPQVRWSIFPVMWWQITIDHYYGTQAKFFVEDAAWAFIFSEKLRQKAGRPVEVKFKYEE